MRHLKSVTYLLPFVLVSLYSASASAEIYRWVDDKGQTHFSSQPPEGNAQKAERYNVNVQRPAENVEGYKLPSWQTEDEEKPEAEPKVAHEIGSGTVAYSQLSMELKIDVEKPRFEYETTAHKAEAGKVVRDCDVECSARVFS